MHLGLWHPDSGSCRQPSMVSWLVVMVAVVMTETLPEKPNIRGTTRGTTDLGLGKITEYK